MKEVLIDKVSITKWIQSLKVIKRREICEIVRINFFKYFNKTIRNKDETAPKNRHTQNHN